MVTNELVTPLVENKISILWKVAWHYPFPALT